MRQLISLLIIIIKFPYRVFTKVSPLALIRNSNLSNKSAVKGNTRLYGSNIDIYSYIGRNCFIGNCDIGKFCSIADHCYIGLVAHPVSWVSTSPVFHSGKNIFKKNFSYEDYSNNKRTIIENDVWIGTNVCIIAGVRIGSGAVIGAGAIVTKDIEPYSIVAGNPAKLIRKRFDNETIDALLNLQWWNWNEDIITERARYFTKPADLIEHVSAKL